MTAVAETTDMQTEWGAWREKLEAFNQSQGWQGGLSWAVKMEQMMLRSEKETRCAECGAPAHVVQTGGFIQSVARYFLCDDCDAYFEGSVGGNRYTVLGRTGSHWARIASLGNRREAARIAHVHEGEAIVRLNEAA